MASDESMTLRSCISMQEDEHDDDTDEGYDQDQPHHHLSRLSMCTNNSIYGGDDDHEGGGGNGSSIYYQGQPENGMSMYMSLLSIDSFDGDVDEEEDSSNKKRLGLQVVMGGGMSTEEEDSDMEPGCYSLPATPPRRRRNLDGGGGGGAGMTLLNNVQTNPMVEKEYASENEARNAMSDDCRRSRRRSRRRMMKNRSSWLSPSPFHDGAKTALDDQDKEEEQENMNMNMCGDHCHSFSGESEGTGMVVIARPKGGNRSLCMDMEEVKACRDLGFELEQQQEMIPSRLSASASTLDTNYTTSSGGNSPIANWRISSPGDHPQEVKARLKAWAQAVAMASASPTRHSS